MDGGSRLHLQQGIAAPGRAGDAADGGAGGPGVGERNHGTVGLDVAQFRVRRGDRPGEDDETLVPADVRIGTVVMRHAGREPEQGGRGDSHPAPVTALEPALSGTDHNGDMVVEDARPDDRKRAVLTTDTEAAQTKLVMPT